MLWWKRYGDISYDDIMLYWHQMSMLRNASSHVNVCFYRGGDDSMLIAINDDLRRVPTAPCDAWTGLCVFTLPR